MNILQATKSYEDWMRMCTTLVESQIRDKHARMKQDLYAFFRGTVLPLGSTLAQQSAPNVSSAPKIISLRETSTSTASGPGATQKDGWHGALTILTSRIRSHIPTT